MASRKSRSRSGRPSEVTHVSGRLDDGRVARVAVTPPGAEAINPAFDVTPAELIDGFITERGIVAAEAAALARAFGRTPISA